MIWYLEFLYIYCYFSFYLNNCAAPFVHFNGKPCFRQSKYLVSHFSKVIQLSYFILFPGRCFLCLQSVKASFSSYKIFRFTHTHTLFGISTICNTSVYLLTKVPQYHHALKHGLTHLCGVSLSLSLSFFLCLRAPVFCPALSLFLCLCAPVFCPALSLPLFIYGSPRPEEKEWEDRASRVPGIHAKLLHPSSPPFFSGCCGHYCLVCTGPFSACRSTHSHVSLLQTGRGPPLFLSVCVTLGVSNLKYFSLADFSDCSEGLAMSVLFRGPFNLILEMYKMNFFFFI